MNPATASSLKGSRDRRFWPSRRPASLASASGHWFTCLRYGLLARTLFGGPWSVVTGRILLTAGGFSIEIRPASCCSSGRRPPSLARAWASRSGARLVRSATPRERSRAPTGALLQASLAIVADALVVIDDTGRIQSFSHAAERLFGWSAEEVEGENFSRLMPAGEAVALDGDALEGEVSGSSRQVMGLNKDSALFPMELRIGDVRSGGRRFLTMVVRDLTSIQEAERRSEELRAQLTQVWSLNSMGEMASVLAHELNQPLSAVTNYLRAARNLIARMELDDDDLIDAVARAGDQAVRAGEIIRTMRDLATRGGALQKPESLSTMIGEVDFIVSLMARDAAVRIVYDLYKGEDTVMADRIQIQQLVVNLARNAIEALTKYPNRQVNISTRPDVDGGMVTTVEDSGPGIDPAWRKGSFSLWLAQSLRAWG